MSCFDILEQALDYITEHFGQGNKWLRKLKRMNKKALQGVRQYGGYTLHGDERLTDAQLMQVFLPDTQSPAEAYAKIIAYGKDEKYVLLLLWIWAADLGKTSQFISPPQIR